MPVIGIDINKLKSLIGKDIPSDDLVKKLTEIGCDVEGIENLKRFKCLNCDGLTEITEGEDKPAYCSICGIDFRERKDSIKEISPTTVIRMELLAVRPDIFDAGGLSRGLKGYLGIEKGLKNYTLKKPTVTIKVDTAVESVRPYIVGAVIKNINFDDDSIKTIMKLQENLHWALGRNRKHASIGVYDYDKINGDFLFTAKPGDFKFIPLGYEIKPENSISIEKI
ncbi:MAG: hypothetical protein KAS39_01670, partial [Actinomycetia bacterium]|nr:hypothetical protein [Actinomycetes bacterium]